MVQDAWETGEKGTAHFKNCKQLLQYQHLLLLKRHSGGQSSNPYLNAFHFFNTGVKYKYVAAVFLHWCLNMCSSITTSRVVIHGWAWIWIAVGLRLGSTSSMISTRFLASAETDSQFPASSLKFPSPIRLRMSSTESDDPLAKGAVPASIT